ncbi:hypothetical protein ABIF90_008352 [Bradyrhizobium japonicum]
MSIFENVKEYMQRATGLRRPGRKEAPELACARKPHTFRFKDDGSYPITCDGRSSSTVAPSILATGTTRRP